MREFFGKFQYGLFTVGYWMFVMMAAIGLTDLAMSRVYGWYDDRHPVLDVGGPMDVVHNSTGVEFALRLDKVRDCPVIANAGFAQVIYRGSPAIPVTVYPEAWPFDKPALRFEDAPRVIRYRADAKLPNPGRIEITWVYDCNGRRVYAKIPIDFPAAQQ